MSRRKNDKKDAKARFSPPKENTEEEEEGEEEGEEGEERGRGGRRRRKRIDREAGGVEDDGMSMAKQATLLTHHPAIEDSVDVDKVWPDLQDLFDDEEQGEIQAAGSRTDKTKKMLDVLINKDDEAFDIFVDALQTDYKWLAVRLEHGVKEEEHRVSKLGKGIRKKIALSLLTTRISERQKDAILERVTPVVQKELTQKANRVHVPDHRAVAQLDREHNALRDIIRYEIDPLLYGEEPPSGRTEDDYEDVLAALRSKLEELQSIEQCYSAMELDNSGASPNLPMLLLEKIEEVKDKIDTLETEKLEVTDEAQRLERMTEEQKRSISRLEHHNRNLEMENNTLDSELQWLDEATQKEMENKKELEKQFHRVKDENRNLLSEIQQIQDELSSVSLRNKTLDMQNSKLVRDNVRLSSVNTTLRKEAKRNNSDLLLTVQSENRFLETDRMRIKKDLHRLEADRRHLVVNSKRLESENRNLREQKTKLDREKRLRMAENRMLKMEAQRLAIGKYTILPPITENGDDDDPDTSRSVSRTRASQSRRAAARRLYFTDSSGGRPVQRTPRPLSRYDDDEEPGTGRREKGHKEKAESKKAEGGEDKQKGKEAEDERKKKNEKQKDKTEDKKKETGKDTKEEKNKEIRKGGSEDKTKDTHKHAATDAKKGIQKDTAKDEKKGTQKDAAKDEKKGTQKEKGTKKEEEEKKKKEKEKDAGKDGKKGTQKDEGADAKKKGTKKEEEEKKKKEKEKEKDGKKGKQKDADDAKAKGDDGKTQPTYLKNTNSSKRHEYLEEEGRTSPAPRRAAARK